MSIQILSGIGVGGAPNTSIITAYDPTTKIATLSPALGIAPGATSKILLSGLVQKTIVSVSSDTITLNSNSAITQTKTGLGYQILPKLNVVKYNIIRTDYIPD